MKFVSLIIFSILLISTSSQAQLVFPTAPLEVKGNGYSLTFPLGWSNFSVPGVSDSLLKQSNSQVVMNLLNGTIAMVFSAPINDAVNQDSILALQQASLFSTTKQVKTYKETYSGHTFNVSEYTYDSLALSGANPGSGLGNLGNNSGTFRIYTTQISSVLFTVMGTSLTDSTNTPYKDIESALKTLKLSSSSIGYSSFQKTLKYSTLNSEARRDILGRRPSGSSQTADFTNRFKQ